jgi:hypothetical protein
MFIRSTGLGRTLLKCHVEKIEFTHIVPSTLKDPDKGKPEPGRLMMTMQSTEPVSWTVHGFVEPADIHLMLKAALKPSVIFAVLKFLIIGDKPEYAAPAKVAKKAEPVKSAKPAASEKTATSARLAARERAAARTASSGRRTAPAVPPSATANKS